MISAALPRFDRPLAKVWPPSFAVSSLKEVPSYQPKVLVFRPDAPHAAAEVFSQGWATMSQVQTAEISPAEAKGDWVQVETEFEDRSILWWGGLGNSTEHTAYVRLKSGIPAPQSGSRPRCQ